MTGPFFFEVTVTGASYLTMLQDIITCINDLFSDDCYFQHDGVPLHYHTRARNFLNAHFPGRWIG
jgi:hypothetical protein